MIIEFLIIDPLDTIHSAYFKILGRHDTYDIRIKIENGKAIFQAADCTCPFGSVWSQTETNKSENKRNGKVCRHITEVLNFLEKEGWINERRNIGIINIINYCRISLSQCYYLHEEDYSKIELENQTLRERCSECAVTD